MQEITAEYLASQGLSENFNKRFWNRVDKTSSPNGCWIWNGAKSHGYGAINRGLGNGNISANRAAWILCCGPIPEGLQVCHDCPGGDNPACCNPNHLFIGTAFDNCRDMWKKGRANPCGGVYYNGEQNIFAKLTNEQANEIRKLYKPFVVSANKLAAQFGVSKPTILRIIHGVHYPQKQGMA